MKKLASTMCSLLLLSSCNPLPKPEDVITQIIPTTGLPDSPANGIPAQEQPPLLKGPLTCEEARFVNLINIYRVENNLEVLKVSISAVNASRWHARDMIAKNYFSHTEPAGRTFSERAISFGYPAWGENIAAGNASAAKTFCQWKNSPGHNSNMLTSRHRSMGIGNSAGGTYRSYWANIFGPDVSDIITDDFDQFTDCSMPISLPEC